MENENQEFWKLKVRGPVSEQTFLEYLGKVCKDKELQGFVLEYYERLKNEDAKDGPIISKETFGVPYKNFVNGQKFDSYDIVNDLFSNNEKISKAEFFRYQFLNFVNGISMASEISINNAKGVYNPVSRTIETLDTEQKDNQDFIDDNKLLFEKIISGKQDESEFDKKYYTKEKQELFRKLYTKNNIFHELTHAIMRRSLNNGKFIEIITGTIDNRTNLSHYTASNYIFQNKFLHESYRSGLTIINEILIDAYAKKDLINSYTCIKSKNAYSSSVAPEVLYNLNDTKYSFINKNLNFSYILFMFSMLGISDCPEKYLLNPKLLEDKFKGFYFREYKDEICKKVYRYYLVKSIKEKTNIDKEKLKQAINAVPIFELFLIVIGELSMTYTGKQTLFSDLGRTMQAMLLNQYTTPKILKFNELLSGTKKDKETKSKEEFANDTEQAKTLLTEELANAKILKEWIIKNNIAFQMPGYDSRIVTPSSDISEHDFARMEKNEINIKIWDTYIYVLVSTAKQVAPDLLKTDKFLSREAKSFEKEAELKKYLQSLEK